MHHAFSRGLGCFSCCSTVCCIAVWMLFKCWSVVVCSLVLICAVMMAVRICLRMRSFCLSYLFLESILWFGCFRLGILSWKIVYVGKWSVIGGEMVPAVVAVSVSVVSVGSISEFDLWMSSYLVGVVIVVCKLFCSKNMKQGDIVCSFSRFMVRSSCILIDVLGYRV